MEPYSQILIADGCRMLQRQFTASRSEVAVTNGLKQLNEKWERSRCSKNLTRLSIPTFFLHERNEKLQYL